MAARRSSGILRLVFRAPVFFYRWRCGWLLGHRFLLLVHIGRRTGLRRCTVLEVAEYRENGPELVVVSAFGRRADWLRNIEASPHPEVITGSQHFTSTYRILGADEAVRVLAGYQHRNRLIAPIIRLGFSWLLGWKFDGSQEHRRRLAAQLPFVAFRPRLQQSGNP
ncbi:MAG TPA: nitroreductase family deazaflavin-dependent oxidoreductase [Stellaceae bacterium]|nr:nitroreductase family deazaflavin-dependent oxidoreductase [Stellaceae bacterium]